jgi:hypothetical protein
MTGMPGSSASSGQQARKRENAISGKEEPGRDGDKSEADKVGLDQIVQAIRSLGPLFNRRGVQRTKKCN